MNNVAAPLDAVFIAGYSRSGSTLLSRALDAVPGVVSVGELRHIWVRGFGENRRCECGETFAACGFWREVMAAAFGRAVPVERAVALQRRVDRAFLVPRMGAPRRTGKAGGWAEDLTEYRSYVGAVLHAAGRVAGAGVVVDASKDPSHGYVLAGVDGLRLSVVHLIRDPRAVAHSWGRVKHDPGTGRPMPRQSALRSSAEWSVANLLALGLHRRSGTRATLRYEDFVADPTASTTGVLDLVGLSGAPLPFRPDGTVHLGTEHAFSGNPLLFERGAVKIRPDEAWRTEMSTSTRRLVSALTLPVGALVAAELDRR